MLVNELVHTVLQYYSRYGRKLPWRESGADSGFDPYNILVSEMMLQQTQVSRVIPKYTAFLSKYPTFAALAKAPLSEVLTAWQGLGYNRRAKFLHQTAKIIIESHNGRLPKTLNELVVLPGVGPNTAGAIIAYAYNQPVTFIETNIRSVFLYTLYDKAAMVSDKELLPLVEEGLLLALKHTSTREWYWALMDYGTYLKSTSENPSRRSAHHTKQSRFKGSRRELRGKVLRILSDNSAGSSQLRTAVGEDGRLEEVIETLLIEQLIHRKKDQYYLGDGILPE